MTIVNSLEIRLIQPESAQFENVVDLAGKILDQDRYLIQEYPHAITSRILGAFAGDRAVGFLRFLIQEPGAEEGRTSIFVEGKPIIEAYVEAFGVDPALRRQGIGSALQQAAIEYARNARCWQIRSKSPITSVENYALKLALEYVVHPSPDSDSYYFILKL